MKEQRVSIDTAKLAKSKGFDISTGSNCWVKTLDGDIIHNNDRRNIIEHDRCEFYLSQPTHSLLKKWIRDVHNIDVNVYHTDVLTDQDTPEWNVYLFDFVKRYPPKLIDVCGDYESGMEIGLNAALEMIQK